ncbi:hypothetical protein CMK12_14120 [Candidatus Poribacteria bacterium]|nr:hypothetical protein [Candidatus Poribacteria bacterium]MDP6599297.1 hypothetical protein [Candidatus Poribacteria bacterium]MDP6751137.1 hypothetical protein [Candidatus Poribacteria bacterium]MDP6996071.1 hypothetical protein [Candidatus Poribacteria bacterium]
MTRGEDLGLKPCPLKSANIYLLKPYPTTIDRQYRTFGLSPLLFQWVKMLLPYLVLIGSQITPRPVSPLYQDTTSEMKNRSLFPLPKFGYDVLELRVSY